MLGVGEHRAVQAWLQLQSDSWEPGSLEVLQRRRYSTVYRLNHATQHLAEATMNRTVREALAGRNVKDV